MAIVLVVDDEPLQRDILKTILDDEGYETYTASSSEEGLRIVKEFTPDVVLTDLKMERMDGIEFIGSIPREPFEPSVVIMTAYGTISSAVEAIKKGAFDYLTKPLDKDVLLITVKRAVERVELLKENLQLQKALFDRFKIEGIIGSSIKMVEAVEIMKKVSSSTVTVLILGESGTGKELGARAIHYNSSRRTKPFTAINCAAIPENLLESELFGYEPGAFTGALSRKIGLIEATNGGTFFLDEVGDLPQMTQSKILRVLQDKEIRRLGGRDTIRVDIRIIAATNKDLEKELQKRDFREDLYYRLKVVTIELPPLRERKEDIFALTEFFIKKYNQEFGKRVKGVEENAMKALIEYHWPGNIRQLESVIERAVLMSESPFINLKDIKSELRFSQGMGITDFDLPDEGIMFEELEKELLKKAMLKANGVATKAARLLGMSYKTFWYRWEKFNLNSLKKDTLP
ncbi:MAG: DNA-binding response regulator [Nitrospirae bacterium CG_4_9_14_3_um_filter_41_27]|nr:sigma-54-dependent Fis family transcriptional regulator [Nitrospirota bacterium]OIP58641.1 MAG: DNA-binding response regulator [Nitrospirae bacterium CG2_30_41_42]PIW87209.1 MAG: DNA-binding response regulator [Nitrospirae bacterium CG_4_8_14_3_um_filter_41_47]PJA80976.1 MAG: DNA-binding response regulator [Nitrospirae bacterium CG_4_9_14_3_um_filter_41_27]